MQYFLALITGVCLMATGIISTLEAQSIGTWSSYTSQSTVIDLVLQDDGVIWASSEGGIFIVDGDEIIQSLSTIDGMHRIMPESVTYDTENNLFWLGYNDGTFESYNRESGSFRQFLDISRATRFNLRGINNFVMDDDDLLIATDFGLVLFDPQREVTLDTYSNLGEFPGGTPVNDVLITEDRIFAATIEGIAVSGSNANDLAVPDNWENYGSESGFNSSVSTLALFDGSVHAFTSNKLYRFDGTDWMETDYFQGAEYHDVRASQSGTVLAAWTDDSILLWNVVSGLQTLPISDDYSVNTVWVEEGDGDDYVLYLGTTNFGIIVKTFPDGEVIDQYLKPGPYMNSFSEVNYRNGILASGSSELWGSQRFGSSQSGYYLLREGEWHNFNNVTHPLLQDKNFNSAYTSASNSENFFFGSWGRGLAQHHIETDEITIWNHENSILRGIQGAPSFIVVSGIHADRHDNLWLISWLNNTSPLYKFVPETEEWSSFPKINGLAVNEKYQSVTVDSHDQLWITIKSEGQTGRGLVVKRINEEGAAEGVVLREEAGNGNLPHLNVKAVVQDRRGEVWIGTERGLARFPFPQRVITGGATDRQASFLINADETADSPFLLRTSNVTSIAVNSANQKWIGTDGEGVWLIEEEGGRYRALRNFTTDNSPLPSNTINSIAYDDVTGQVYFATDLGLLSYTDVVRGSVTEMDELFIYPNPFSFNRENEERVVIDRLSEQTTIRIMTVDGRHVRRLETRGGRVEWDIRDFNGDRVATGIYIVVSVDDQNDQRGVGKVVVVR